MSKIITWDCPNCKKSASVEAQPGSLVCPHCKENCGRVDSSQHFPVECPRCTCSQFYLVKDFNQALGCIIILIGILLVPRTYGLSLVGIWLINLFLFKRIPPVAVCYRCSAEFRGFKIPEYVKPFNHQIGAKYNRKRR